MLAHDDFLAATKSAFAGLAADFGLEYIPLDAETVIYKANSFLIEVTADRFDGMSLIYYDLNKNPPRGYNILLFLFDKRRNQLSFSHAAATPGPSCKRNYADNLARHLGEAGRDILAGDKAWLSGYTWPTVEYRNKLAEWEAFSVWMERQRNWNL